VFPRAGPDLLDKQNLLLSGHEPRMFHVITLVTIPENGSALFIEVCTSLEHPLCPPPPHPPLSPARPLSCNRLVTVLVRVFVMKCFREVRGCSRLPYACIVFDTWSCLTQCITCLYSSAVRSLLHTRSQSSVSAEMTSCFTLHGSHLE
jgi:hypothetical protein